jgi:DNA-binding transcriptional ArsR family regulator
MSSVDSQIRAMAHEGRRAMLRSTLTAEKSASDLAAISGLSRPATSQHLATLLEAGLLTVRSEGRHRWYRADPVALDTLRHDLDVFWSARLNALKRAAES